MKNKEIKERAREFLEDRWFKTILPFLFVAILTSLFSFIPPIITYEFQIGEEPLPQTYSPIGIILNLLTTPIFLFGLVSIGLKITHNKKTKFTDVFSGFFDWKISLKSLLLTLLVTLFLCIWGVLPLISIVILYLLSIFLITLPESAQHLILGTSWIFIISLGVLFVRKFIAYSQVFYIFVKDTKISPFKAIKKSKELMKNNIGKYFKLQLSFIGWFIVAFILMFIIIYPFSAIENLLMIFEKIITIFPTIIIVYMSITNAVFHNNISGDKVTPKFILNDEEDLNFENGN